MLSYESDEPERRFPGGDSSSAFKKSGTRAEAEAEAEMCTTLR